jgi:archaellum component FlaC
MADIIKMIFSHEDMLTDEDIQKLAGVLATKDDICEIKEDLNGLRESVQSLTISVDRLVKAVSDLRTEYAAIINQVNRHEKWFQMIADKIGVKLDY